MKAATRPTVLITGATSGIGEACARLFAEKDYPLILIGRRTEKLSALKKELPNTEIATLDVSDGPAVASWFAEASTAKLLSNVEVLINNAGLALGMKTIQELDPTDWNTMIDTNVKGLIAMTRGTLPHLLKRGSGHIVNMGSVAGFWNYPKGNVYAATKAAVRSLTESMRLDLNGTGIRVTEISPGMVETEFSEVRFGGDKARAKSVYQGMDPLTGHDIAEAILWAVERPARVNIQEIIIYPTDQASPTAVTRKS